MLKYYHFIAKGNLHIDTLKEIIASSFHEEFDISYNQDLQKGYIVASDNFYNAITLCHPILSNDLGISLTVLVSYENTAISYYALKIAEAQFPSKISSLSDIYLYCLTHNDDTINNHLKKTFENVSYEMIQTGLELINSGLNACLAAKRLYIHRNTFNYRLNKFIEETSLDIRDFDNALLFYLYMKNNK